MFVKDASPRIQKDANGVLNASRLHDYYLTNLQINPIASEWKSLPCSRFAMSLDKISSMLTVEHVCG
jgi:hypothetical protein